MEEEEELVVVKIPFYDEDGDVVYFDYRVPISVADYMQELRERYYESEAVCRMLAESQQTTKILNDILVRNSGRN